MIQFSVLFRTLFYNLDDGRKIAATKAPPWLVQAISGTYNARLLYMGTQESSSLSDWARRLLLPRLRSGAIQGMKYLKETSGNVVLS
ncbi:hypothetical protein CVV67_23115 [Arthrobacter stackebrandtii]|nr:hypothetical protein CVV67_23115 [Arthrobacter stackebrandtii]